MTAWLAVGKASGLLAHLAEVTCDMWDGYAEPACEAFGVAVQVTIDRFHVMTPLHSDQRFWRRAHKGWGASTAPRPWEGGRHVRSWVLADHLR